MSPSNQTLDALRREIDAVDDAMHDLLMKRATLSEQVRVTKGTELLVFRPGREATILRRLVARHGGALPPDVIVQVWREIISASIRLQTPFRVAVYAPAGKTQARDLAQAHFGVLMPLLPLSSPGTVLRAIGDGQAQIGLMPLPEDVPSEPWWRSFGLGGADALFVLARLPFAATNIGSTALVVGRQPFEPSDADRGYLVVETDREISRARLSAALAAVGLAPIGFPAQTAEPGRHAGGTTFLVETEVHIGPGDPRLALARTRADAIMRIRSIGGYARPLALPARRT